MKKTFALILALVLIFGVTAPASAAETLDSRLAKVTLAVKNTLEISDSYENFDGTLTDQQYAPYWTLNWYNNDGKQLNIIADESGKIFYYQYYENEYYDKYYYSSYFEPAFPSVTQSAAKNAALDFIKNVLSDNESVVLEEQGNTARESTAYSFNATIKVNGLDSPFNLSITVRTSDLTVTYFSRDDLYTAVKGGYPSAKPSLTSDKAKELLSEIYELEPEYILTGDSKIAQLVYLPKHSDNYVIDAVTGELVEITRYYPMYRGDGSSPMDAKSEADMDTGLTQVELDGIAQLEGVKAAAELDSIVRKISIFDISSDFTLRDTFYYLNKETGDVTATLSYNTKIIDLSEYSISDLPLTDRENYIESPQIYKTISINAKTGKIESLSTYYSGIYKEYVEAEAGKIPADVVSYIKTNYAGEYAASELNSSSSIDSGVKQDQYIYHQKANGYFYANNSINVTVNSKTGKIDSFYVYWDKEITFEPVKEIVTADEAEKTYSDAYKYNLGYSLKSIETKADGYTQVFEIILSYTPFFDGHIQGINAVTGKLMSDTYEDINELKLSYDDLNDSYAKDKINTLAEYGVGFYSPSFKPAAELTQKDMILLLISADGSKYKYSDITNDILDQIYESAYYLGILDRGEKSPDKKITRAELVRTIVSMSGYGKAAEFKDIYICGFTDDSSISKDDYGYIAIGKGLGIISGDSKGKFNPNAIVTRQDAAVMLYNFMSRDSK